MARAKVLTLVVALTLSVASLSNSQSSSVPAIPEDLLITMERTGCFGSCPIYKLTINASGQVTFEGRRDVKKVGKARSKITTAQVHDLVTEFEKINYILLLDNYGTSASYRQTDICPQMWTDMPTVYTSFTSNRKTKNVAHYHGCMGSDTLESLSTLENRIDEIVNSKQWIK